jgi:hypothetical protein
MNIDLLLSNLQTANDKLVKTVTLTDKSSVKVLPISVLQQKSIINNVTSSPLDSLKVIKTINDIVTKNSDNADNINIIDRELILISINTGEEQSKAVSTVVDKVNQLKLKISSDIIVGDIKVSVSIPQIHKESAIISAFIKNYKDVNVSTSEIAANLFVWDIVKCINYIAVEDEKVEFNNVEDIASYIKIVEKLPTKLNNMIVEFVESAKKSIHDIFDELNITIQTPLF